MPLPRTRAALLPLAALALSVPAAAQQRVPAPSGSPDPVVLTVPGTPAPVAAEEYASRRRALAEGMGDGVLVVYGADEPAGDFPPFAQTSAFRYLTGLNEPGAVLVMVKREGRVDEHVFVLPRDPAREVWDGPRMGAEQAARRSGAQAHSTAEMEALLPGLMRGATTLYALDFPEEGGDAVLTPDQQNVQLLRTRFPSLARMQDLGMALYRLRSRKSPAELDLLRRSIAITVLAQREAMRAAEPGMAEFEVQALIEGTFRRYGAERPGFGSIVGSGPNSTTLHYRDANRVMRAGETMVVDIGASYGGYSADVTRTMPIGGRWTAAQREIYAVVLAAQKGAEAQARPGVPFLRLEQVASDSLAAGLARLGLIESPEAKFDCEYGGRTGECPQVMLFYMHGVGHGIGLDVHDPEQAYPGMGSGFAVGSAFTIEPGIYVRGDALSYLPDTPRNRAMIARLRPAVETYRGIGVRIEDDYFITADGAERISAGAPRELDEIEALMARESLWNRERRPELVEWYHEMQPSAP